MPFTEIKYCYKISALTNFFCRLSQKKPTSLYAWQAPESKNDFFSSLEKKKGYKIIHDVR